MHQPAIQWRRRAALGLWLSLPGLPPQQGPCDSAPLTTRTAVEACLATLEPSIQSGNRQAEELADRLRQRLRDGDFHAGERIYLRVASDSTLTDTLTVLPGPSVRLPTLGPVPLAGVLRGDLTAHFAEVLSKYLRSPIVEAKALVRLSVVGQVGKPGFYAVPSETALADVFMLAGGLTQQAKTKSMRIERDATRLWDAAHVREALAGGRTIDDLGLREGDRIVVPAGGRSLDTILRVTAIVVALPAALWGLHSMGAF